MRNLLAHSYYKVDMTAVWKTIEKNLPYLQEQVTIAIRNLWVRKVFEELGFLLIFNIEKFAY